MSLLIVKTGAAAAEITVSVSCGQLRSSQPPFTPQDFSKCANKYDLHTSLIFCLPISFQAQLSNGFRTTYSLSYNNQSRGSTNASIQQKPYIKIDHWSCSRWYQKLILVLPTLDPLSSSVMMTRRRSWWWDTMTELWSHSRMMSRSCHKSIHTTHLTLTTDRLVSGSPPLLSWTCSCSGAGRCPLSSPWCWCPGRSASWGPSRGEGRST